MKLKSILALAVVCTVGFSCSDDKNSATESYYRSYVQNYIMPAGDGIRCQYDRSSNIMKVYLYGTNVSYSDPMNATFESLSLAYGDLSYNRNNTDNTVIVLGREVEKVTVTSSNKFGGSNLRSSDVIFLGSSPYKYIQSGYTETFDWSENPYPEYNNGFVEVPKLPGFSPVWSTLDLFEGQDQLYYNFYLKFKVAPDRGEHRIKVVVTVGGTVLEDTVTVTI